MTDFDNLFSEYLVKWYERHSDEYSVEQMEDMVADIYEEWANAPEESIGGKSPRDWFGEKSDPQELIDLFLAYAGENMSPPSLLLDRIAELPECAPYLLDIVKNTDNKIQERMLALNLFTETGGKHDMSMLAGMLTKERDKGLRELAVEILAENADEAKDFIFPLIDAADGELKADLAEILVRAEKDERTYELLVDLFNNHKKELGAGYLGKYGDERCISMLYKAADTCTYLEYLEIKNAIERMGGVLEDVRDFSDDKHYQILKKAVVS